MLDIQKELEKFNRLLEEVDEVDPRSKLPSSSDDREHPESEEQPEPDVFAATEESAEPFELEEEIVPVVTAAPVSDESTGAPSPAEPEIESAQPAIEPPVPSEDLKHHWTVVEHLNHEELAPESTRMTKVDTEAVKALDAMAERAESTGSVEGSLFGPPVPTAFDTLIKGAKTALTDTHRPKPKPSLTVTLPSVDELERDVERDRGFRQRVMPLLNGHMDTIRESLTLLENHIGAVSSVAAAVVVLIAGVIFVPRMISNGETDAEALASVPAESDSVHLFSSSDDLSAANVATLSVSSYPPGARVYLGADLIGVTPFQGISVDRGLQSLSIRKADYLSVDTMLTFEGRKDLFFELPEDFSAKGQSILDGTATNSGLVEASPEEQSPSSPVEEVPANDEVTPEPVADRASRSNRSRNERTAPVTTGSMVITSDPIGATVFVDGQEAGQTPLTLNDVAVGKTRVTMQREGYVPYEVDLNVMPSLQTPFHAVLAPMKGRIEVRSEGGADLYIDGVLVRKSIRSGYVEVVDVGEHAVELIHPVYGAWSTSAEVRSDETTSIDVDLEEEAYRGALARGDRLFSESKYAEAIEAYNRALAVRPGVTAIENKIGLAAKAMSEPELPSADGSGIYSVVDTPPQLVGGLEALHASVQYPQEAYDAGIQGRVYVQFVVDEKGRPMDLKIAKGLPMGCNEAALRAVERARFTPGLLNGRPVKVRHTVFVNFTIN